MKIDLHIHTKKVLKDEPESIEITSENFKKQMQDANIRIAAITNHRIFDLEQYNQMKSEDYILLPGVELEVEKNGKTMHANVIAPPEEANILSNILESHSNDKWSYEEFIRTFNKEKWIICLDYKNDRRWEKGDAEQAEKDFNYSFVLMDVNKAQTLMILNSHSFDALIGTDIKDWKQYHEESKKLLSTPFTISSYDIFWKILKHYDTTSDEVINKLFDPVAEYNVKKFLMPNTDYSIENLILKERVNVIFGEKRTGKTEILKIIHEQNKDDSMLYISSDKDINIDNIRKNLLENEGNKHFEVEKKEIIKIVEQLSNYEETKFTNFSDFLNSCKIKGNSISFHERLGDLSVVDPTVDVNISNSLEAIEKICSNIANTIKNMGILQLDMSEFIDVSKKIIIDLWNKKKSIYKKYWMYKFVSGLNKSISELIEKNKGRASAPIDIKLLKRFEDKQKFKNEIVKFKKFRKRFEKEVEKFNIPNRIDVSAKYVIDIPDIIKETNIGEFLGSKGKIKDLALSFRKWQSNKLTYKEFSNQIDNFRKEGVFYNEKIIISDSGGADTFSNGEKSHLLIANKLKESADKKIFLFDEPGVFLSRDSITNFLLPEISKLVNRNKIVVIATHNSTLGVNTIPINYIFRKYKTGEDECFTYKGSIWENEFVNILDSSDRLDFQEEICKSFEGSKEHFKFRKDIYGN